MNGHMATTGCTDPDRHLAWALSRLDQAQADIRTRHLRQMRTHLRRALQRLHDLEKRDEDWFLRHALPPLQAARARPNLPAPIRDRVAALVGDLQ